jgi:hypothetical protein
MERESGDIEPVLSICSLRNVDYRFTELWCPLVAFWLPRSSPSRPYETGTHTSAHTIIGTRQVAHARGVSERVKGEQKVPGRASAATRRGAGAAIRRSADSAKGSLWALTDVTRVDSRPTPRAT